MRVRILQHVGSFEPGQEVKWSDFPQGADHEKLTAMGVIIPLDGPLPKFSEAKDAMKGEIAELLEARVAELETKLANAGKSGEATELDQLTERVEKLEATLSALLPKSDRQWDSLSREQVEALAEHVGADVSDIGSKAQLIESVKSLITEKAPEAGDAEPAGQAPAAE